MLLLRLAFRNLMRNRRRTLITGAAISFGMALMLFTIGMQHGSYTAMIRTGVASMAGHVVVQGKGYEESGDNSILVWDSERVAGLLEEAISDDGIVLRRAFLGGLLTSADGSSAAVVSAIEPEKDREVGKFHDYLHEGEWLSGNKDILLGSGLAETLDVELGDKIVYMMQIDEEMTSKLFRVKGILRTGAADQDGIMAAITLEASQELRGGADAATQVVMILEDFNRWPTALEEAREALAGEEVEVLSWKGALPDMDAFIKMDRNAGQGMLSILGIIVAMGVFNTFLMSVLERTREFGVLLSIGVRPGQIAGLVLLEGVVLGALFIGLGVVFGLGLTWPAMVYGMDFTEYMGEAMSTGGVVISAKMHSAFNWPRMSVFALGGFLLTVLASVWPAWRVSRLTPVDAMRHQ
jgi:ABC-type lipoprotein release transport system permease subunit